MSLLSSYPVLMVTDPVHVAGFYVRHFGFEATFTSDWYVSLRHAERPESELAFLDPTHETIPSGYGQPSRGVLVNLEVTDAAAEHARLVSEAGLEPVLDLRDEEFGQRHFIVRDPAGNLVDVIENIPPSAEFADAYRDAAESTHRQEP